MPWTDSEIAQRLPVWEALSEFWLDGWLDDSDFQRISKQLLDSPYSKNQLQSICIYEVAPAVSMNLYSIAGVWGGFEPNLLCKRIIQRSKNPTDHLTPSLWKRFRGLSHKSYLESCNWNRIFKQYST